MELQERIQYAEALRLRGVTEGKLLIDVQLHQLTEQTLANLLTDTEYVNCYKAKFTVSKYRVMHRVESLPVVLRQQLTRHKIKTTW